MKEYHVLVTKNESRVNQLLKDGWSVIKNILEDFKIEKGYPNLGVKIS